MTGTSLRSRLLAALQAPGAPSSDYDLTPATPVPDITPRRAGVLAAFDPALPGGKVDPGDIDETGAALREAEEEVGLPRDRVEVLGLLPAHRTVTGFSMIPVLGLIHGPVTLRPEAGEVAEIFTVPFDHIADPANYRIERRLWRGDWRAFQTVPWGPYYIWGATARVLHSLARRLNA